MPALIQNYRKHAIETRMQKFYSVINQAIKLSEVEHGDKKDWFAADCAGMECPDYFNEYIGKYIATLKTEPMTDASYDYLIAYLSDGSGFVVKTTNMSHYFFFPEMKNYNPDTFIAGSAGIGAAVRADTGVKFWVFTFNPKLTNVHHYDKGVEPYKEGLAANFTRETLVNNCQNNNTRNFCTALIQYEGWKIPDDYPIKF